MTHADKRINPQHFGTDPANVQIHMNSDLNPRSRFVLGGDALVML